MWNCAKIPLYFLARRFNSNYLRFCDFDGPKKVIFFKIFGVDPKIEERDMFWRGLAFAGTSSAAREHALILIALHFPPVIHGHVLQGQVPIFSRFSPWFTTMRMVPFPWNMRY